ncbi:MAG: hypothetical protein QOH63_1087 [Acidobacteriota bacterium]|jgi:hypothetical protein|nr:hypothetical protein [Acidobacteriota bacterium]
MNKLSLFSSPKQLNQLVDILSKYIRLPFSSVNIPGAVLEAAMAHIRRGTVLRTYDFVDVIKRDEHIGWQMKSTLAKTPVTWKRAKIPDSPKLIKESKKSAKGAQELGDAILTFCNAHAAASLGDYDLNEIGFSRLIVHASGQVTYYERLLCSKKNPVLFNPEEFKWKWSEPKKTIKKEQLSAFHGTHIPSGKKWFAWHGLGENQLHFPGEKTWWPKV